MPAFTLKHLAAAAAIVGSLSYLCVAGYRAGIVYYLSVEQVLDRPELVGTRVRLHGVVRLSDTPVQALATGSDLQSLTTFQLAGASHTIAVDFRGTTPEGFAAGREVVVEGHLDSADHLAADVLLTKCASKYQPGQQPTQGPG